MDPNTGRRMKVVHPDGSTSLEYERFVTEADLIHAHQKFCDMHGEKCRELSLAQGKTKRLIPGLQYLDSRRVKWVMWFKNRVP